MSASASRILAAAMLLAGLVTTGCPSAYDRAYDSETQRLEAEQQQRDEQERAAHAEASKYAAVVYFDTGSAVIKEAGYRELGWFAEKMQPFPQVSILIQGFADATGGDALNQKLSEQRAEAVAKHLSTLGIASPRLIVQGFASEFPAAPNETSKGRLDNRRVEVTVR
jgi:outer membrane protein OmpA-like peptidoglycan-associated protein